MNCRHCANHGAAAQTDDSSNEDSCVFPWATAARSSRNPFYFNDL